MNEGVLIRYLGKWMTFRRPLGLDLRGRVRCGQVGDRWGVEAFFHFALGRDLFGF